jgi:hypothetical protein
MRALRWLLARVLMARFFIFPLPCIDPLLVSMRIMGSLLKGVVPGSVTPLAEMFVCKEFPNYSFFVPLYMFSVFP